MKNCRLYTWHRRIQTLGIPATIRYEILIFLNPNQIKVLAHSIFRKFKGVPAFATPSAKDAKRKGRGSFWWTVTGTQAEGTTWGGPPHFHHAGD